MPFVPLVFLLLSLCNEMWGWLVGCLPGVVDHVQGGLTLF